MGEPLFYVVVLRHRRDVLELMPGVFDDRDEAKADTARYLGVKAFVAAVVEDAE